MLEFEGILYYAIPPLICFLVCLAPTIIGCIGYYVIDHIERKNALKIARINDNVWRLRGEMSDKTGEEAASIGKEIEKLIASKPTNYSWLTTAEVWFQSWYYGSLDDELYSFIFTILGSLTKIVALIMFILIFTFTADAKNEYKASLELYENAPSTVVERMAETHPTKAFIEECEEWNKDLHNHRYLNDDFKNDAANNIDTETLWARLYDNIAAKRKINAVK